jgi:glycine C-acetyltransferase/8-amino-7-oxononanoate synthase
MESAPGARTLINGRWRDYFAGTGYLGLQGHPGLIEAATSALQQYGITTATSRGGYGEHPVFHAVETAAACFFQTEAALYTVSAYLGSSVLLQGLHGEYDRVYVDDAAHFSVREAVAASGAPSHAFRHLDAASLRERLRVTLASRERPLVLTDGVFPISGEIAPLCDHVAVLADYDGAILCVDDAHATGVIGVNGRGSLEFYVAGDRGGATPPLQVQANLRCFAAHTLSKALAGHGGVIAGSIDFVEQLWRNARALSGSSPSPIPAAAASAWSLNYVHEHGELRDRLWSNVRRAKAGFRRLGWDLPHTPVPILCLAARPGLDLARIQQELFARDLCVAHITRYSSTPEGGALRVAVFATHTEEQIDRLVKAVEELL